MRWVLIRPRSSSLYYDPEVQEPLGIECLAAWRKTRGDAALVLDATIEAASDAMLGRRAAAFEPDAIGFSLTTAREAPSVRAIHAEASTRLAGRSTRWLAGGNFVTTEAGHARSLLPAGLALVRFEGERALDELASRWTAPPPGPDGGLAAPSSALDLDGEAIDELDSLPFPVRPYAGTVLANWWAFNLQGSRGCCGACRYCSSPGMTAGRRRWRGRSPEHIVAEIADLARRFGARSFNFVDEDFLGPDREAAGRVRRLCALLAERRLDLTFGIQVRPTSLGEEIIDLLTAAGLRYVFMGIESDDPNDFRRWGRPFSHDPWLSVDRLRARGAEVNAGVLLFHPHATLTGIRRFAETLHRHGLLEFRSAVNRMAAMPGSAFYAQAVECGEVNPDATGPQLLAFADPAVAALHSDLLAALEPLGPPSMHALCCLPARQARRAQGERDEAAFQRLKAILAALDGEAARGFFTVLDAHERGNAGDGLVGELRARHLATAVAGARELAAGGFARSFDELRQAIHNDSGM